MGDYSPLRMNWGHSGLLHLEWRGLSPFAPCQFDWRTNTFANPFLSEGIVFVRFYYEG
jgi:hypothetical protein